MKQIVAIIKPFLAEKVIRAIGTLPVDELMVREVKGYGRQKNYLSKYEDNEFSIAYLPKVEITVWVDDALVEPLVELIQENSRTGRMGDGKILVLPTVSSNTGTNI
ncbi:MAG TPA: P-II family nitrogen regulator [Pirellulaceae bacterium]|nr:P-II family nitrogen regulator [Pirellulaceae bacterium]HMO94012.1 P-II family nitrogen regulator [Pirellulaceae bacterium]HMP70773.1 P-II family nitrogen regulator [Pirellulaceae bacterium]